LAIWKFTHADPQDGEAVGEPERRCPVGLFPIRVVTGGLLAAVTLAARPAWAHGFGQRYDLPVPLALWVTAAAAAVAFSFVMMGIFVRAAPAGRPSYPRLDLLHRPVGRLLPHPALLGTVRMISVALLLLVVGAGLFGNQNPTRNLAPTMIWVLWWVGFAYTAALLGNVWTVVNPWNAVFRWAEAAFERGGEAGDTLALGLPYPRRLGAWPALGLFMVFAWTELVFEGRAVPLDLAFLVILYSLVTWTGMFLFGRVVWLRYGDPFAVAFALLARFAPTEIRVTDPRTCADCPLDCQGDDDCVGCEACFARAPAPARQWNLRPFGMGLLHPTGMSASMMVFVVFLLASVTFDGLTATPVWAGLESWLYAALPELAGMRLALIGTLGLLAVPAVSLAIYGLFSAWMARAGGREGAVGEVARVFVLSLVPIAIAYHLAHYLSYLLIQGQLIIPLASDPFGAGWDLFGTAAVRPDIGLVGARFAWYTAVVAIVLGHILAVYVAHHMALRQFGDPRMALRSQYPMLALMVGYTVVSLWIIAQPIVESTPTG
jgi:hypothetical protein